MKEIVDENNILSWVNNLKMFTNVHVVGSHNLCFQKTLLLFFILVSNISNQVTF